MYCSLGTASSEHDPEDVSSFTFGCLPALNEFSSVFTNCRLDDKSSFGDSQLSVHENFRLSAINRE